MANRTSKQNAVKTGKSRMLVLVTILVLAILWIGWWLVFKHNVYSPDKNTVKQDVQSLLDSVSLKGQEVYSDVKDQGCESNTVGTATSIGCGFVGYKYYKDNGSLAQELRTLDTQILNVGWQRAFFNNQTSSDVEKVLNGESVQLLSYINPHAASGTRAYLGYYKDEQARNDAEISKLIAGGRIQTPTTGEYIYGVHIGASYWSCNYDSIFKICPFPPNVTGQ